MLPPDVIDKLNREKMERERASVQVPCYAPEPAKIAEIQSEEDDAKPCAVIVIDLV